VPALSRSLSAEAMVSMVIPPERGNRKSQKERKKNRSTYAIPYCEIMCRIWQNRIAKLSAISLER